MDPVTIESHECNTCGYRGPLVLAYSKVLTNRSRSLFFVTMALRFVPVLGFAANQLLNTPRESCPKCGEHIMVSRWTGAVSLAELELYAQRQTDEDGFKRHADNRVLPILGLAAIIVLGVLVWQLT